MHLLFFRSAMRWSADARLFLDAADALRRRGGDACISAPPGSWLAERAVGRGVAWESAPAAGVRASASALARVMRARSVDVVFVDSSRDHLTAAVAARLARRGVVVHRVALGRQLQPSWRLRLARRLAPARGLGTTAGSATDGGAGTTRMSWSRTSLGVLVPFDGTTPVMDPVLTCVASRGSLPRVATVLRAFGQVRGRHADARFRVVGSAALDPEVRVHAASLQLGPGVEWVSADESGTGAFRGAAACCVAADGDEAVLGALDAMAAGVPVIGPRIAELVHHVADGIHGVLLRDPTPAAVAAECAVLLDDPGRRQAMGDAGRLRVEREFSDRVLALGFEGAARDALERVR